VSSARLKNVKTGEITDFPCEGVFIFVGIEPNTGFIKNYLNIDETGFIITGRDLSTSRNDIYACGDCRQKTLYQVINACGDGAVAAHSVHQSILNHG
ncbi:MAG: NAD(P)/FAD-dependent oxidoreductase, partial [Candidatus Omnitrophica bacterium]|nr:NAD(P)/FAD-dependent oxidoreductase [Candidatus Omnitrophota bacterium]